MEWFSRRFPAPHHVFHSAHPPPVQIINTSTMCYFSLQLTIYLGKRDFVDNMGTVEPVGKSTSVHAILSALLTLIILW